MRPARLTDYRPVIFGRKFGLLREQWQPRVVAELNDYQFKVVRLEGDSIWHSHADTVLRHADGGMTVVPVHGREEIGPGLLAKILRDCDMSRDEPRALA